MCEMWDNYQPSWQLMLKIVIIHLSLQWAPSWNLQNVDPYQQIKSFFSFSPELNFYNRKGEQTEAIGN